MITIEENITCLVIILKVSSSPFKCSFQASTTNSQFSLRECSAAVRSFCFRPVYCGNPNSCQRTLVQKRSFYFLLAILLPLAPPPPREKAPDVSLLWLLSALRSLSLLCEAGFLRRILIVMSLGLWRFNSYAPCSSR